MRVAVAKDALKQIELEKFIPTCGNYIDDNFENFLGSRDKDEQVQKALKQFQRKNSCSMCARGAILLSTIRKFNDVKNKQFEKNWESKSRSLFGNEQLRKMERVFEDWISGFSDFETDKREYEFVKTYPDSTDRLKAILKNVIKNKGTFIL